MYFGGWLGTKMVNRRNAHPAEYQLSLTAEALFTCTLL